MGQSTWSVAKKTLGGLPLWMVYCDLMGDIYFIGWYGPNTTQLGMGKVRSGLRICLASFMCKM